MHIHMIMDNWDDIRVFLAIARCGNLTAAGKELALTQPSVGRRLALLEERLGSPLFLRSGRQWTLTELGRDLAEAASTMQTAADAIDRKTSSHTQGEQGIVRVTSTDGLGAYWLPDLAVQLRQQHPSIMLEVITGNRPLDLSRRSADIALRLYRPEEDDLIIRKLGKISFRLFASPAYLARWGSPATIHDLPTHSFIGQALDYDNTVEFAWLRQHVAEPDFVFRSGSAVAQAQAAKQGMGIALLPRYLAYAIGGLTDITLPVAPTGKDVWLATHRDLRRIPKVATAWDFIKSQAVADNCIFERDEDLQA